MTIELLMPALSPTMETGTLAKWLVKTGDSISPGDIIAEIETDKATMEVESVEEGIVQKLLVEEGAQGVPVNTAIALIQNDDEAVSKPTPVQHQESQAQQTKAESKEVVKPVIKPSKPAQATLIDPDYKGETVSLSVREALRDAMLEEMVRDDTVFIMGEEVGEYQGAYKVTQGLLEKFGERRVIDTPITEYGFTGIGCGAALAGLRPIVEFMTFNFAMQAIDHIINTAAKTLYMSGGQMKCPIVFRGPNGPASRVGAQHSQDYSAWYASVPGLTVIAPFTAADAKGLLKSAIRDPNPVVFLENELLYGQSFDVPVEDDYLIPIGLAKTLREGADVTIVSYSQGLTYCLEAATMLEKDGIEADVIDLRTLRPLDMDSIINSVKRTNRLVVVEEGWPICSIGSHIMSEVTHLAFDHLDAPPLKVSGKDVPMPYAANLEKLALPSAQEVVDAVHKVCYFEQRSS